MGIFDRWRRKKEHNIRSTVHAREIMWTEPRPSKHLKTRISTHSTPVVEGEIKSLLAKRDELAKRRKELQQERNELTRHLDNGEISPIDSRKHLMAIIQEAAEVSESLRATTLQLTEIGHQGLVTD